MDVLSLEDVPKEIENYHVCIVKSMKLDSNIISRAVQMQLIMQYGVGLEGTYFLLNLVEPHNFK